MPLSENRSHISSVSHGGAGGADSCGSELVGSH
jgi:hypothetical protein